MFSIDAPILAPAGGGRRAVVADDDPEQRAILVHHLRRRGFAVDEAEDGYEALSIIGREAPELALLRRRVIDCDGDRAAALARMLYPHTRIILTASQPVPDAGDGPFLVLARPVDLTLLDRWLDGRDTAAG